MCLFNVWLYLYIIFEILYVIGIIMLVKDFEIKEYSKSLVLVKIGN